MEIRFKQSFEFSKPQQLHAFGKCIITSLVAERNLFINVCGIRMFPDVEYNTARRDFHRVRLLQQVADFFPVKKINHQFAAGFKSLFYRTQHLPVFTFRTEISKTGKEVKHKIEIMYPERAAHIVHIKLQPGGFVLLCFKNAFGGKINPGYLHTQSVQDAGVATFATGEIEYTAPGRHPDLRGQRLYKSSRFFRAPVPVQDMVIRTVKPISKPFFFRSRRVHRAKLRRSLYDITVDKR